MPEHVLYFVSVHDSHPFTPQGRAGSLQQRERQSTWEAKLDGTRADATARNAARSSRTGNGTEKAKERKKHRVELEISRQHTSSKTLNYNAWKIVSGREAWGVTIVSRGISKLVESLSRVPIRLQMSVEDGRISNRCNGISGASWGWRLRYQLGKFWGICSRSWSFGSLMGWIKFWGWFM